MFPILNTMIYPLVLLHLVKVISGGSPPSINTDWSKSKCQYFPNNQRVDLQCKTVGTKPIRYTWTKDGSPLNSDDSVQLQGDTLVIEKAKENDNGIYQCFAENEFGRDMSDEVVLRKASFKREKEHKETLNLKVGDSASLSCETPEVVPMGPVVWWVNNATQQSVITDRKRFSVDDEGTLHITHIIPQDEGKFLCEVSNPVLGARDYSAQYSIEIDDTEDANYPDKKLLWSSPDDVTALTGNSLTLSCVVSGNPTPEVHWNRTLSYGSSQKIYVAQHMRLPVVDMSDAGMYTCYTADKQVMKTIRLKVESSPRMTSYPTSQTVEVGNDARFACRANGNPTPTIKWFINGREFKEMTGPGNSRIRLESNHELVFQRVLVESSMLVQCNASNIHGYTISKARLQVTASPLPTPTDPSDKSSSDSQEDTRSPNTKPTTDSSTIFGDSDRRNKNEERPKNDSETVGAIIGGVCAALFVILLALIIYVCHKRKEWRKNKESMQKNTPVNRQCQGSPSGETEQTTVSYEDIGNSYNSIYDELHDEENTYNTLPLEYPYVYPEDGPNTKSLQKGGTGKANSSKVNKPKLPPFNPGQQPYKYAFTHEDYAFGVPADDKYVSNSKTLPENRKYLELGSPGVAKTNELKSDLTQNFNYLEPVQTSNITDCPQSNEHYFILEAALPSPPFQNKTDPCEKQPTNNYFVLEKEDL